MDSERQPLTDSSASEEEKAPQQKKEAKQSSPSQSESGGSSEDDLPQYEEVANKKPNESGDEIKPASTKKEYSDTETEESQSESTSESESESDEEPHQKKSSQQNSTGPKVADPEEGVSREAPVKWSTPGREDQFMTEEERGKSIVFGKSILKPSKKAEEMLDSDEDDVPGRKKDVLKVMKKKRRPKLIRRERNLEDGFNENISPYTANVHHNIRLFFHYNDKNLVRPHVTVEEAERTKARAWVFFLIFIQFTLCVIYSIAVVVWIPRQFVMEFIAISMLLLFSLKFFALIIFFFRRLPYSRCVQPTYDPEKASEICDNIFICIPAYNEGKDAFQRTIGSVVESNYPKEKLYMFFIVDGNQNRTFESLMSVLKDKEYPDLPKSGEAKLEQGSYRGVNYSVYLKNFNRGKRDSQWLFVEIMRNMIPSFKPPFVFFVDSDTAFSKDSIRYLWQTIRRSDKVAGVCGKLELSNFTWPKCGLEGIFNISTLFVVGFQNYEYFFNQIIGKQAEAAFDSVTCLPGAFSMLRTEVICNIEARFKNATTTYQTQLQPDLDIDLNKGKSMIAPGVSKMNPLDYVYKQKVVKVLPLILDDFFSKPTIGILDRNLYELGEDRTLTVKMLERGLTTTYDPRAVANTECPDTIGKLLQQRRRWNNSTFVNLVVMVTKPALWFQFKTFPVMIFTLYDLIGSYFLPANAILLMATIWDPLLKYLSDVLDFGFILDAPTFLIVYLALHFLIMTTTKMPESEFFYILTTFISGCLMVGSFYFIGYEIFYRVTYNFILEPMANWPLLVITWIFPLLHLIASVSNPLQFFTSLFFYIMFPTVLITIPIYAFLRLDDFSWGTR